MTSADMIDGALLVISVYAVLIITVVILLSTLCRIIMKVSDISIDIGINQE